MGRRRRSGRRASASSQTKPDNVDKVAALERLPWHLVEDLARLEGLSKKDLHNLTEASPRCRPLRQDSSLWETPTTR